LLSPPPTSGESLLVEVGFLLKWPVVVHPRALPGALTHPLPFSFEKEKGDTKISSYNCSPSLIQLERGELKGVSEN
jgi:hypothetical protein